VYCGNNPLTYTDPTGLEIIDPSTQADSGEHTPEYQGLVSDDVLLSADCYNCDTELPDNLIRIRPEYVGLKASDFSDDESGFQSQLYYDKNSNQYVVAFAGTDTKNEKDAKTDVLQGAGQETIAFKKTFKLTEKLIDKFGRDKIRLTGHSLGGGEAAAAGTYFGVKTRTFNAAGVHKNTLMGTDRNNAMQYVTNYVYEGDVLTCMQESPGSLSLLPKALGEQILLGKDSSNFVYNTVLSTGLVGTGAGLSNKFTQGITVQALKYGVERHVNLPGMQSELEGLFQ